MKKSFLAIVAIMFAANVFAQDRPVPGYLSGVPGVLNYQLEMCKVLFNSEDYPLPNNGFTIEPSLMAEKGVRISREFGTNNCVLVLTKAVDRTFWGAFRKERRTEMPTIQTYELKLNEELGSKLQGLLKSSVLASAYPLEPDTKLDGLVIGLFSEGNTATLHSPEPSTNCAKLIDVLRKICDSIEKNDVEQYKSLVPEMERLTQYFTSLWPKE